MAGRSWSLAFQTQRRVVPEALAWAMLGQLLGHHTPPAGWTAPCLHPSHSQQCTLLILVLLTASSSPWGLGTRPSPPPPPRPLQFLSSLLAPGSHPNLATLSLGLTRKEACGCEQV